MENTSWFYSNISNISSEILFHTCPQVRWENLSWWYLIFNMKRLLRKTSSFFNFWASSLRVSSSWSSVVLVLSGTPSPSSFSWVKALETLSTSSLPPWQSLTSSTYSRCCSNLWGSLVFSLIITSWSTPTSSTHWIPSLWCAPSTWPSEWPWRGSWRSTTPWTTTGGATFCSRDEIGDRTNSKVGAFLLRIFSEGMTEYWPRPRRQQDSTSHKYRIISYVCPLLGFSLLFNISKFFESHVVSFQVGNETQLDLDVTQLRYI